MIVEYHRPQSVQQALDLLGRPAPLSLPLGGGSMVNRAARSGAEPVALVDLQALGLDRLEQQGSTLQLGATLTLQALLEGLPEGGLQPALGEAIRHEAGYNLRQAATVAGTLLSAAGRSPFTTALLALDAQLLLLPGDETVGLGDLLPVRRLRLSGRLVVRVSLPANARLRVASVARTPYDRPLVYAAVAAWPSGRTRVALGGFGEAPTLAFDGTEANGAETAARSAYSLAGDEWASAEYRQDAAAVLVKRCLE
ncbi:MAG: FAD binding domain-containing protein [Chloroflexota bacterium]